jgi:hypothetical protein
VCGPCRADISSASLRLVQLRRDFDSDSDYVQLGNSSEIGDRQRGREALNMESEGSTALRAITRRLVKTQRTEKS